MTWNEPGADPAADLQAMFSIITEGKYDFVPNTLVMGVDAYVACIMATMEFGWWPMSVWRRRRTRQRLRREILAEAAELAD